VSAHKKYWVFRGGIVNSKYASDSIHGDQSCTGCHGGAEGTADKALAHGGMKAVPGASTCAGCHLPTTQLAAASLHTTLKGYEKIIGGRGFDLTAGSASRERYDKQCTRCHVAVAPAGTPEAACGQCHVSVPEGAGGGLVSGHRIRRTPDTVNNCTACHGSRVKDEYMGLNNALHARNVQYSAEMAAVDPNAATTLVPDVHSTRGMGCVSCHPASEMHGVGVAADIDRYGVTGRLQCTSCHPDLAGTSAYHRSGHLSKMACQVCHSQPYKSCFSCHTQESGTGAAYFTSNGTDPTRAARRVVPAAWSSATTYAAGVYVTYAAAEYRSLQASNTNHVPDEAGSAWWTAATAPLPAGDALITFRAGLNPKFGLEPGAKKYAVLRHVPVDADVFTYDEEGTPMPGLIPDLSALPTWKYATPHNIVRQTAITSSCDNCHGAGYASFWLTDAFDDAYGWVPAAGFEFEGDANAAIRVTAPFPMGP
jgi:hypothetical protein